MKFDVILDMMTINDSWEQIIIHQRYTTQGAANLANTHMWQVGDYFYCHNGVLRDKDCDKFAVDSQNIGAYLETDNVWDAIAYCQSEQYANTFIVNLEAKKIWVTRSLDNTLFTDGRGQFSTKELKGLIDKPVPQSSVEIISLEIEAYDKWSNFGAEYDSFGSYTPKTYEQKIADSTHGNDKPEDIPADEVTYDLSSIAEIEMEMTSGYYPSLDDTLEIERALHFAMANGDTAGERKYNYLLEKANGNG